MRGFSVFELVLVVVVMALLAAVTLPTAWRIGDRVAVRRAARETALFYHAARQRALLTGGLVRIAFAADTLRATLVGPPDSTLLRRPGPARHGATLTASRPAVTIDATGLGFGGANTTLVLSRGSAVESLTTSRTGRLRWR